MINNIEKGSTVLIEAEYLMPYVLHGTKIKGLHVVNVRAFNDVKILPGIELMVSDAIIHSMGLTEKVEAA